MKKKVGFGGLILTIGIITGAAIKTACDYLGRNHSSNSQEIFDEDFDDDVEEPDEEDDVELS